MSKAKEKLKREKDAVSDLKHQVKQLEFALEQK